jgi:hypothetical protein
MHKYRFGLAYCIDLLKRISKKFILHSSKVYSIFNEFSNFE